MAIKLKKTQFVTNLIKNHKLAGHIDKAIGDGEFSWTADFSPKVGDDAWHPSGDCVPNANALYHGALKLQEERQRPSAGLLKAFTVGHFWHAYIQHIVVERLGFSDWSEIECKGETRWGDKPFQWATGSADIAPCRIPVHGDFLVDIKTMGSHDFRQNNLPAWCASKYECQINVYMDWFDLDRAIILCVSKDSPHDFKEFEYHRNQPLIDSIYDKWKLVGRCLENEVEPPQDYETILPLVGPKM